MMNSQGEPERLVRPALTLQRREVYEDSDGQEQHVAPDLTRTRAVTAATSRDCEWLSEGLSVLVRHG
jgi:hypothetical protein